jgi:hypothetical protein
MFFTNGTCLLFSPWFEPGAEPHSAAPGCAVGAHSRPHAVSQQGCFPHARKLDPKRPPHSSRLHSSSVSQQQHTQQSVGHSSSVSVAAAAVTIGNLLVFMVSLLLHLPARRRADDIRCLFRIRLTLAGMRHRI